MKRIILCVIGVMFVASIILFTFCGGAFRDMFSPKVVCRTAEVIRYSERINLKLDRSAVLFDEESPYVYVIEPSDKYSEGGYQTVRVDIDIIYDGDADNVIISANERLMSGRYVANPVDKLNSGMRVSFVRGD